MHQCLPKKNITSSSFTTHFPKWILLKSKTDLNVLYKCFLSYVIWNTSDPSPSSSVRYLYDTQMTHATVTVSSQRKTTNTQSCLLSREKTLYPVRPKEWTQPGLTLFSSGWSILLHKKNTTHRQLVSLRSNKVKCTDCCLRQGWLDYDATSPPFHSFRLGEGEPDRKPVNKTKKGGNDSKLNWSINWMQSFSQVKCV